jgi:hypothetical protein
MRAVSAAGAKTKAVFAAFWVVVSLAPVACYEGGAGGPGVEPPWRGNEFDSTTAGTGGVPIGGEGVAGSEATPGEAGSTAVVDGAAGTTPPTAGGGGSIEVGGADGSGISGQSGAGAAGEAGSTQEPDATTGCRGPEQEGCAECCEPTTDAGGEQSCARKSATSGSDWYNSIESLGAGACPSDCEACAQCSFRDEEQLAEMETRPDCACDTIVIGIDPCFAPMSCECYCQTYNSLAEACPHLAE